MLSFRFFSSLFHVLFRGKRKKKTPTTMSSSNEILSTIYFSQVSSRLILDSTFGVIFFFFLTDSVHAMLYYVLDGRFIKRVRATRYFSEYMCTSTRHNILQLPIHETRYTRLHTVRRLPSKNHRLSYVLFSAIIPVFFPFREYINFTSENASWIYDRNCIHLHTRSYTLTQTGEKIKKK